jgi:hypothetical protein
VKEGSSTAGGGSDPHEALDKFLAEGKRLLGLAHPASISDLPHDEMRLALADYTTGETVGLGIAGVEVHDSSENESYFYLEDIYVPIHKGPEVNICLRVFYCVEDSDVICKFVSTCNFQFYDDNIGDNEDLSRNEIATVLRQLFNNHTLVT